MYLTAISNEENESVCQSLRKRALQESAIMCSRFYANIIFSLIIFTLIYEDVLANHQHKTIRLKDGEIRGRQRTTIDKGKLYYSFQGIPYAKPPVGDLRFAHPRPPTKWNHVLDATKPGKTCIEMYYESRGSEDCLYLNVFTPNLDKSLPVIVWIHGGSFAVIYTNNTLSGVDFFIDEELVFVTVHYRLGPFGFLSTEDDVIPGNFGLKDQVMAVQWVHQNIEKFGGDPKKIVLMGESSGAVATAFLGMIPQLKGKIAGVIQQSGTAISEFSLGRYHRLGAYILSTKLGLQTQNTTAMLEYLRKANVEDIRKNAVTTHIDVSYGVGVFHGAVFIPCLEAKTNKDPLLTEMPYEQLKHGYFNKVPRLIGINSLEGMFLINEFQTNTKYYENYDQMVKRFIPASMNTRNEEVGHFIKKHYTNGTLFTSNVTNMVHYGTDEHFVRPIIKDASLVSEYATTYLYEFSYQGKLGYSGDRPLDGVDHGEDLRYFFYDKNEGVVSEKDKLMRRKLVRLWSNFAKYGNPTHKKEDLLDNQIWSSINPQKDDIDYMNIGSKLTPSVNPHRVNVEFWDNLFAKYGNPPYDVY
ncbi:Carboxylesterase family [Popillia japonica]|uniref:Carboxylic ester hydrolase n=1 Tax=Popillia japonica TaxID=7064 RepID=A0AAW1KKB0_POPJA